MRQRLLPGGVGFPGMKRNYVGPFRNFYLDGFIGSFRSVILGYFEAQSSRLHSNCGIRLGIEVRRAPEDLRRDLVFLQRRTGMVQCMFSEIT